MAIRFLLAAFIVHLFFSPPASSFDPQTPPNAPRSFLFEEKTRLGSTPPSCHNKCNECHPCMAVQVPTLPGRDRVQPSLTRPQPAELADSVSEGGGYSNYKPLGWKCRCGNHFFNP